MRLSAAVNVHVGADRCGGRWRGSGGKGVRTRQPRARDRPGRQSRTSRAKTRARGGAGGRTLRGRGGACAEMTRDPEIPARSSTGQGQSMPTPLLTARPALLAQTRSDPAAPPKQVRLAPWKIPLTGELGTVDDPDDGPDTSSTQAHEDPPTPPVHEFKPMFYLSFCTATNAANAEPDD